MDEDPKLIKQVKAELSWLKLDLDGSDCEKAWAVYPAPRHATVP